MNMKNKAHIEYAPEIPEFKGLGRKYFARHSANEFWGLLVCCAGMNAPRLREEISEHFKVWGEPVPKDFRYQDWAGLRLWKAFTWNDVVVGVLRHPGTGLCRPLITDGSGETGGTSVGPALDTFTPKRGTTACLALFERFCGDYAVPCDIDEFWNYVPRFVTREQIKFVFRRYSGWEAKDFNKFFKSLYREAKR
jgi:hypothetical protein